MNPDDLKLYTVPDQTDTQAVAPSDVQNTIKGALTAQDTGQQKLTTGAFQSANFVSGSQGWQLNAQGNLEANNGNFRGNITGATGTFSGTVSVSSLNVPDSTTANSFHVDSSGNSWWGANVATGYAGANAYVLNTGEAVIKNATTVAQVFLAGEAITIGNAVCAGYYQSDGGVTVDTTSHGHDLTTSLSKSITVGSNSNRIVVAVISVDATTIASVQFGGSNMTLIDSVTTGNTLLNTYYILAPGTGSKSLTATIGSASNFTCWAIYSLYNCKQSAQPAAHTTNTGTNTTTQTVTPAEIGDFVIGAGAKTITAGSFGADSTNFPNNAMSETGLAGIEQFVADNGQAISVAAQTFTYTNSGGSNPASCVATIAIAPFTAATLPAVMKASSGALSTYSPLVSSAFRSAAFIGFALSTAAAGANVSITTAGVVSSLTGLTPFSPYYLADTAGTISITPGTITRKVGIATDTTHLTVTNIW